MESVGFIIEGGDVGASQHGADSRTLERLAVPPPLGTGAGKQSGHSPGPGIYGSLVV